MNLNQINYFLAICKTMNFTKAAHNLYISYIANCSYKTDTTIRN